MPRKSGIAAGKFGASRSKYLAAARAPPAGMAAARATSRQRLCVHLSAYPDDLCLSDAEANGLDPEALRERVWNCSELASSWTGAPSCGRAAGPGRQEPPCGRLARIAHSARSSHWSTVRRHVFSRSAAIEIGRLGGGRRQPAPSEPARQVERIRRLGQHLSATAAASRTRAGGPAYSTGGASLAVAGAAGMAGVAAVGGHRRSRHEHHTQAQDMSAGQRVALEQDRRLHGEAQGLAAELSREALEQEARLHRQSLWRERRQHDDALAQERALHDASLRVDHRLHFEGILADLREQDREADRDLWEQRTERFQLLLTVSSLLTAGGFALAVEGTLPPESDAVAPLHYFLLALGFGLQLVILGCLSLTARFAEFMDLRVPKQRFSPRTPRVAFRCSTPRGRARRGRPDRQQVRARAPPAVRDRDVPSATRRHIWNFKTGTSSAGRLAIFVESSFRFGMLGLLGSVLTYIYAVLKRPTPTTRCARTRRGSSSASPSARSSPSRRRPAAHRLRLDGRLMRLVPHGEPFFGPRAAKPVRFDMHHVSDQAEDLFHAIDTDLRHALGAQLGPRRSPPAAAPRRRASRRWRLRW